MSERTPRDACTRRTLLRAGAGATALAATGASGTALAQDEPYGGYLSDANGYGGTTAEYTDTDSVTVSVGAGSNGLGFGLPAIKVPTGTTVTWEWTGQGGTHNVVHDAEAGDQDEQLFRSGGPQQGSDITFEYTFDSEGVYKYYCSPHKQLGMRGVVVVGDNVQGDVAGADEVEYATGDGDSGGSDGGSGDFDFGGYLDNANLYEGSVEDMRGEDEVTVSVGADNGYAFDPPAVRVDPGTTVIWEWTGQGGGHNVVAESGAFDSGEPVGSGTFEHTFEEEVTETYFCRPHKGAGMKGAVVVGAGGEAAGSGSGEETAANETALQTLLAMVVLGLLSPVIFLLFVRRRMSGPPRPQ